MVTFIFKTIANDQFLIRLDAEKESFVPEAPGNRHYEEYLEWVAEGGEPEVIDESAG